MSSSIVGGAASLLTATSVVPMWVKVLPYILTAAAAGGWFWQYTESVRYKATDASDKIWEARIEEFDKLAQKKVDDIWRQSSNFASNADTSSKRQSTQVSQALQAIKSNAKAGEYLEIREGQCFLKPQYVEAFNAVRNSLPGVEK